MIGLDTNVIVRYVLQDDRVQSAKATRIVEELAESSETAFISLCAALEVVWVLQSYYKFSEIETASVMQRLTQIHCFHLQNQNELYSAAQEVLDGNATFEDSLVALLCNWVGCTTTYTFDRKAARLPGFKLI